MDILTSLFLIAVFTVIVYVWTRRQGNLPPGPPSVPFIGNININWKDQISDFRKFRKRYGDIFTLQLGTKTVVVVNGLETLKELLIKNGDVVNERPECFVFTDIGHNLGLASSSGPLWKEHRTFALTTLRDFGFGKRSLEGKIMEEVECFLNTIKQFDGQPFDVKGLISISISNVICSVVFGHRYDHDDETFIGLMKALSENFSNAYLFGLFTFFPFLQHIPGDPLKYGHTIENVNKIERHMNKILEESRQNFNENVCNNYVDAYLNRQKEDTKNETSTFSDEQLHRSILDLFSAGTESTATAITWFILFMLHLPEIQESMRKEIKEIVGDSRYPSLSDRDKLHFCDAVLHETLRVGNLSPFGVPHGLTTDLSFHGYTIPKEAMIFPCIDSILNDPDVFENPMEFNPYRFLAEDGSLKDTEKVLAFGMGRRICLGEALARMELFLFITSIIQRFHLLPTDGEKLPPYTESTDGIVRSPLHYSFRAVDCS